MGLVYTFVIGFPLYLLLRRHGLANAITCSLSGLAIGVGHSTLFALPKSVRPEECFISGATGIVSALVFWFVQRDTCAKKGLNEKKGSGLEGVWSES